MGAATIWPEKGLMPTNNKMVETETRTARSQEKTPVIIQLNSIQNIKILCDVNENIYLAMIFYGVRTLLSNYKLDRFNRK